MFARHDDQHYLFGSKDKLLAVMNGGTQTLGPDYSQTPLSTAQSGASQIVTWILFFYGLALWSDSILYAPFFANDAHSHTSSRKAFNIEHHNLPPLMSHNKR